MTKEIIKNASKRHTDAVLYPYSTMISLGGFEAVYAFIETYTGEEIYVPSMKKIFGQCLEKDLLTQYDGKNAKQLAQKYGFSLRHVQELIRHEKKMSEYIKVPVN